MAEALLRFHAGDKYEVYSAGLEPKGVHPLTIRVMAERGIDLSAQTSKHLSQYAGKINFDYLITVCGNADEKCPDLPRDGDPAALAFR